MSDHQQGRGDASRDEAEGGYGGGAEAEALTGQPTSDEATVPANEEHAEPAKDPNADSEAEGQTHG